jgi:hypothetical protein
MNLYDLAHRPDAFKGRQGTKEEDLWWGDQERSSYQQFKMLLGENGMGLVSDHTNENEFRMHLLFVHWATEGEKIESLF